jgi:hypothetical protein
MVGEHSHYSIGLYSLCREHKTFFFFVEKFLYFFSVLKILYLGLASGNQAAFC